TPGCMSMSFEDGKKRVTFADPDGHTVSAVVESGKTEAEQRAAEDELRTAAANLRMAMDRVKGGWIVKGAVSTRGVTRDGNGWQAAVTQFALDAKKVER